MRQLNKKWKTTYILIFVMLTFAKGVSFAEDFHNGEKIITHIQAVQNSRLNHITVKAMISAPIEIVWQELKKLDRFGADNPFMKVSSIVPKKNNISLVTMKMGLPWPLPKMKCFVNFLPIEKEYAVAWEKEKGCAKHNTGKVFLTKMEDKTLLTFDFQLELGRGLPLTVIHWGLKNNLPKEIVRIRKQALQGARKQYAEAGKKERS